MIGKVGNLPPGSFTYHCFDEDFNISAVIKDFIRRSFLLSKGLLPRALRRKKYLNLVRREG